MPAILEETKFWSFEEIKGILEEIVAGNPDHVYNAPDGVCLYFHDTPEGTVPGCIIGHMIFKIRGEVPEDRNRYEGIHAGIACNEVGIYLDGRARTLVRNVQHNQDKGLPWRQAFTEALAVS